MKGIRNAKLLRLRKEYDKDRAARVARHALAVNTLETAAVSLDEVSGLGFKFDIDLKTLEATDQKRSGRCWIFAGLNVMREELAKKTGAKSVELSESYVAFYDKLEKLNYTLELLAKLVKFDHDERVLAFVLKRGLDDGGQWDMFTNVVSKYGVCPLEAFPDSATAGSTRVLNQLMNSELRRFAGEARKIYLAKGIKNPARGRKAIAALEESYLTRFYGALVSAYGLPPESFDFEYTDKDGKYHVERDLTPESFYAKYFADFVGRFVSVINAPTPEKPFGKTYTIKYLNNVAKGKDVIHLNLPIERFKELILKQLQDGQVVWFGSDVSFYFDAKGGIWDDRKYDYASLLGIDFKMDKGMALDYWASAMNHAMCVTGVALKDGVPTKWKIENSWGTEHGKKGYYLMSASWFDRYVYQAVIDVKYLNDEEKAALKEKPIVLKPWDPMGSLAD